MINDDGGYTSENPVQARPWVVDAFKKNWDLLFTLTLNLNFNLNLWPLAKLVFL